MGCFINYLLAVAVEHLICSLSALCDAMRELKLMFSTFMIV